MFWFCNENGISDWKDSSLYLLMQAMKFKTFIPHICFLITETD